MRKLVITMICYRKGKSVEYGISTNQLLHPASPRKGDMEWRHRTTFSSRLNKFSMRTSESCLQGNSIDCTVIYVYNVEMIDRISFVTHRL